MAEPCGFCTCLIMMQHVQFSPNLYTTALTVLRNVPRDLQAWRTCKLAGPSAVLNSTMVIEKNLINTASVGKCWKYTKNLILNILSSFSIIQKVKRKKQTKDNICPEVRISSIRCHFTRYHSSITINGSVKRWMLPSQQLTHVCK
jgi:hypothetical protein